MRAVKKIALLTSGGDAPGMNACLRGIVRAALNKGWGVYGIRDAYQGLVAGGDKIFPLDWGDVGWNFREGVPSWDRPGILIWRAILSKHGN